MKLFSLETQSTLDLVFYRTYAELRAEAERTYLGVIWWVLEPLLDMVIYFLVFGVIINRNNGIPHYVSFLFVGVATWQWFLMTISQAQTSIVGNVNLVRAIKMNKIVFPITALLINTFKFFISLIVLFLMLHLAGFPVTIHYAAFPVIMFVQILTMAGIILPLSAVIPFFPDSAYLVNHALRLLFFVSGIFFQLSMLPEIAQKIMLLNPAAFLIQSYRDVLMYQQWPSVRGLLILSVVSCCGIVYGVHLIKWFEKDYAKRITK